MNGWIQNNSTLGDVSHNLSLNLKDGNPLKTFGTRNRSLQVQTQLNKHNKAGDIMSGTGAIDADAMSNTTRS